MDFLSPPLPTRRRDASSPVSIFFTEQVDADVFFPNLASRISVEVTCWINCRRSVQSVLRGDDHAGRLHRYQAISSLGQE